MVIHPQCGHPRYAHDRCEACKTGNGRGTERDQAQPQGCNGRKQRNPASNGAWKEQQYNCARERDVNRPRDHAPLFVR